VSVPAPAELARARQALAAARGRRRLDVIFDAPDPAALVRALPADELFFVVQEVGLADAVELVQLAAPSQFRTFVDLDAWREGKLVAARALPWIRAARAGTERDERAERAWRRKLSALDVELVELLLLGALRIHDLETDPDPEILSDRFLRTTEGKFVVEFLVEGTEYLAIRGLLDDFYSEDPLRAARLLTALRWELPSELEEQALRWREGRLHDLGYPPLQEALSWFARPAARPQAVQTGAPARPPGFFLELRTAGSLLARAAGRLPAEEQEALELELVMAANAAMVADGVDPSDLLAVRRTVEGARALVELGLGAAASGDEALAARELAQRPVKWLFQRGFARLLDLKSRAEALRRAATGPFPSALAEALAALCRRRPLYYPGLDLPPTEWGSPAAGGYEPRPFLSEADVARTVEGLVKAERLARP